MCEIIKTIKQLSEEAEKVFLEKFGVNSLVKGFGPGRVNIIGEHTDYNEGYVFPMALSMGTLVIGRKNSLNECRIITLNKDVTESHSFNFSIPKNQDIKKSDIQWINYVLGVINYFPDCEKVCFDAVINNSVPLGSGLSSSASLEVAFYTFLEGLYKFENKLTLSQKALICQKAEHRFANVPCGIMDQFIGFMGKKGYALFIDCRDLSHKLIKLQSSFISVLIVNSNVKHFLGATEYPLRQKDCNSVANYLHKSFLRDVSMKELEDVKSKLEERLYIRARHVISENSRVLDAVEALNKSDFSRLGALMNESHKSLRYDYQVSCPEIDELVDIVQSCPGVLGSRMTGGGFGGCTVSLINNSEINNVINTVKSKYSGNPLFYVCTAEDGAKLIT